MRLFLKVRVFLQIGSIKITIPQLLTTVTMTVKQKALNSGSFKFYLDILITFLNRFITKNVFLLHNISFNTWTLMTKLGMKCFFNFLLDNNRKTKVRIVNL
jgi:hypothetical protein